MKSKNGTNPGLAELMQALNFTDADLKANRAGYLSRRQWWRILLVNSGYIAIAGCFAAVMSLWYLDGRPGLANIWLTICFSSIYGLIFLGLIWLIFGLQRQLRKDLKQPPTILREVVYKPVSLSRKEFTFRIGYQEMPVSRQAYDAFQDGAKYELYYALHTKTLLAAVPLKPDAPYHMN